VQYAYAHRFGEPVFGVVAVPETISGVVLNELASLPIDEMKKSGAVTLPVEETLAAVSAPLELKFWTERSPAFVCAKELVLIGVATLPPVGAPDGPTHAYVYPIPSESASARHRTFKPFNILVLIIGC